MTKVRLFPSSRPHQSISTPLSILDNTVARFSPTGAIWLFDPFLKNVTETKFIDGLRSSLAECLDDFPQWAGQLQWAPVRLEGSHTERFNRAIITYGNENDPGIEWGVVHHPSISADSLAPTATERAVGNGVWIGDEFAQNLFLSDTPLPLHDLREYQSLPAVQIQLNIFSVGGYGIGIKIAHLLADAQTLMVFVHDWAAKSRQIFSIYGNLSLMGAPIFNPALLDTHATGDINMSVADPSLVSIARQLPLHRFDWWQTDSPGYSHYLVPTTENSKPPPEILSRVDLSDSTSAPWTTWDFGRPVRYTQLHYSGTELKRLKEQAHASGFRGISRLDILLAHIWARINHARGHSDSTEDVFLNLTLGARTRVSPPLPESFVGSPLLITHIKVPGASACNSSLGWMASHIRATMQQFTPNAIGAMLHDAAYEVSPQRLWQAFLGTQHTLVTSWLWLNVYRVDFIGSGEQPRYVHAVMPKIDGCLQVMDPGVNDDGIDIALYLDAEAMEKLLVDEQLHY